MLVIDEVSALDVTVVYHVGQRYRQYLQGDENTDFGGGLVVVLGGDFVQLPVVGGETVCDGIVRHALKGNVPSAYGEHPRRKKFASANSKKASSIALLRKFKLFVLDEQMRARLDVEHCTALEAARELHSVQPLSDRLAERLATQMMQPHDLRCPMSAFALMATRSVAEASAYSVSRARLFARFRGVPLVRWRIPIPEALLTFRDADEVRFFVDLSDQGGTGCVP